MRTTKKKCSIAIAQAFAVGGLMAAAPGVWAEDQAAAPVERITITGSSIKRVESEGALPVQTVTRQEIERSGVTSVVDLIQNLPAMQGFTVASQAVGGSAASISEASLHGLGGSRTLVLLNGRRVATWAGQNLTGYGDALDLNSLPLAAIERVEVLTDGASALYGADAVAGVVNFITKTNQKGPEVSLKYSVPNGSVGKEMNFALTQGWGDLRNDGQNLMLAYTHDTQDKIRAADRSYTKSGVIPFSQNGQNYVLFGGSIRAAPANWEIFDSATGGDTRPGQGGYDNLGNPYLTANGTCPPGHVYRGGACRFDYGATVEIFPETKRDNLLATFTKAFGQHTFSADVVFSKFSLTSRVAPPPVDMLIPNTTGLYTQYMVTTPLDPAAATATPNPGDTLFAYWRGVDAGARTTKDDTWSMHASFSLKGTMDAWDYSTGLVHSTNHWRENYDGGWLQQNQLDAAIANGSFDPFLAPGQQSAAGQAAIAGMQYKGTLKAANSTLDSFDLHGSRELFNINGQPAQLGVGVDVHHEIVKYDPSEIAQGVGNNIAGDSNQELPYDVGRSAWGAYAELLTPLSKEFELTTAVRHDHYSDFGNTDNYKLSGRFQPNNVFLLRGSVGSGFRAPSVPQVAAGRQLYGVTANQYNCPDVALAYINANVDAAAICRTAGSQYEQFAAGNLNLKPEKSNQWTIGFRVEPVDWVTAGLDYWQVHIKDRINQLTSDTVFGDQTQYLKNFTVFVDPGTHNHYVAFYLPNENLGEEKYSGMDFDGKLLFNTPAGKLTSTLHWSHLFKHDYQRILNGPWYTDLGEYNDGGVTFKDIIKLITTLDYAGFQHTLTINRKSGYTDYQCTAADCGLVRTLNADGTFGGTVDMIDHKVDAYMTFDWQTTYKFDKSLSLTGGVLNFTNRRPPFSIQQDGGHQVGFDNRYTDPRDRTVYANLNYKF